RNADVIHMASYAPLFVNVNDRKWNPDAICFDNASSYGTPSYYVQKLFAENRPDTVLPLDLKAKLIIPQPHGGVGMGTWRTDAEYRNVRVEPLSGGTPLLTVDFSKGTSGWRTLGGGWSIQEGAYR